MASLTLRLCHSCSLLSTLMFFLDTECPVAKQCSPTPVGLSRFRCSLNRTPRGLLDSPMYVWFGSLSQVIYDILFHICSPRESCLWGVQLWSTVCWQVCGTCRCFRLVDSSKFFGETCYVGYSQLRASGVGAAGSRSVLCSGLARPGDL